MITRRDFLRSSVAAAAVAAVPVGLGGDVEQIAWKGEMRAAIVNDRAFATLVPYPGWRWRIDPRGPLIHEPIS